MQHFFMTGKKTMNSLVSTFLVGVLLASFAMNVHQWRQVAAIDTDNGVVVPKLESAAVDSKSPNLGMHSMINVELLGLTEDQRKQLSDCGEACCCAVMSLREEVRLATVALQEACAEPEVDEEEIMELATALCDLREREVKEHVAALLAVREVLDPEQMQELYRGACKMAEGQ